MADTDIHLTRSRRDWRNTIELPGLPCSIEGVQVSRTCWSSQDIWPYREGAGWVTSRIGIVPLVNQSFGNSLKGLQCRIHVSQYWTVLLKLWVPWPRESRATGRQYELDAAYFNRIRAMDFTLTHDDGQMVHDLADADIVIVGASNIEILTSLYCEQRI